MNVPPTKATRSPSFSSNGRVDGAGFAASLSRDGSAARAGARPTPAATQAETMSAVRRLTLFTVRAPGWRARGLDGTGPRGSIPTYRRGRERLSDGPREGN